MLAALVAFVAYTVTTMVNTRSTDTNTPRPAGSAGGGARNPSQGAPSLSRFVAPPATEASVAPAPSVRAAQTGVPQAVVSSSRPLASATPVEAAKADAPRDADATASDSGNSSPIIPEVAAPSLGVAAMAAAARSRRAGPSARTGVPRRDSPPRPPRQGSPEHNDPAGTVGTALRDGVALNVSVLTHAWAALPRTTA